MPVGGHYVGSVHGQADGQCAAKSGGSFDDYRDAILQVQTICYSGTSRRLFIGGAG